MLLGRGSKLFFSENVNINFQGEENISNISRSKDGFFNADRSELFLQSCDSVEATMTESLLVALQSKRIKLRGQRNVLRGENNDGVLFSGDGNAVDAEKIHELTWCGSRSECKLDTEEQPKVFGNDNRIIAKSNSNLLVVGNRNNIFAQQNANLRVRGCLNNVYAQQTRNLTVDGSNNNCYVSGTNFGHSLIRVPKKSSIENVIQFHSKLVPTLVCEGARTVPAEENLYASYYHSKRIPNFPDNLQQFEERVLYQSMAQRAYSEVKILYVDNARIMEKYYRLGIFDFSVDGLNLWEGNTSVKVKILWTPVEGQGYKVEASSSGNCATATIFSKDGTMQRLRIVASKVVVNPDDSTEFDVKFEPTDA